MSLFSRVHAVAWLGLSFEFWGRSCSDSLCMQSFGEGLKGEIQQYRLKPGLELDGYLTSMQCQELLVQGLSLGMILGGVMHFVCLVKSHAAYGRYVDASTSSVMVSARLAWFLQELPALLVSLLLLLMADGNQGFKGQLMLWMFCLHYFQR